MLERSLNVWRSLLGAILFYTILPIPYNWQPSFERIARWCPLVGLLIGGCLSLIFWGLNARHVTPLIQGAIVTTVWLGLTGGLHLDGAMDSADGLAVTNPEKRLEVMTDSVTGAFGVMAAILIIMLKFAALSSLTLANWWLLLVIPIWGRWSQVWAIAFYPYLKSQGKGAFHKKFFQYKSDLIIATLPNLVLTGVLLILNKDVLELLMVESSCMAIAIIISQWFYQKFQGHTGDTYGATVEWTESWTLIINTALILQ